MKRVLFVLVFSGGLIGLSNALEIRVKPTNTNGACPIQEAIDRIASQGEPTNRILLEPGDYREKIVIPREVGRLEMKGEDALRTRIVFHHAANTPGPNGHPVGTSNSATVTVRARWFSMEGLTIENDFGQGSQAVALRLSGEKGSFRHCRFMGWQDTLLLDSGVQEFEQCRIEGHCDFIFGAATAWFEQCEIHARAAGYLTAASTPETQKYGYVFHRCRVSVAEKLKGKVYLGRPWRPYASVIWIECEMAEGIAPEGWDNWRNPANEATARYAEYRGKGDGAEPSKRVSWSRQLSAEEAAKITREDVLGRDLN